jgi:hypothetical protein
MGRVVARTGKKRHAYTFLVGKPEVRRALRRPGCRWADSIKMYQIHRTGQHELDLPKQYRNKRRAHANAVMNVRVS